MTSYISRNTLFILDLYDNSFSDEDEEDFVSQKAVARDEAEISKMKHELQALVKQPLVPIGKRIYERTFFGPKIFF